MTNRINTDNLKELLEKNSEKFKVHTDISETGIVYSAGDGIAHISGLTNVMSEEMLIFNDDIFGLAMNLERDSVGAIIIGDYKKVQQGDTVVRTKKVIQVPVGKELLGRVVNPLGEPIDGLGPINAKEFRKIEMPAPGIVERQPVCEPLHTGVKSIDAMTPVGRGQRELIVGDRQTGKTSIAIDAIINQKAGDVYCVYVAIAQKMSTIRNLTTLLEEKKVLHNCIIVAATASDPAPARYIAPFAACTMAEHFRNAGEHSLIIYDDLYKHAVAYREISLLLKRPPGREAFPGDIFYLHSRLLERACKLSDENGGGSMTALPIVETQQGDYSAYVPTNLVSITDGQIYLDTDLFHQGFRPAINVGLSVSRVGGQAQLSAMKKVALKLRMDLAQYRDMASFAQLTTDLDEATTHQLHRGERLVEILKQPQNAPLPVETEIFTIWLAIKGHLDDIPLSDVARFTEEWMKLLVSGFSQIPKNVLKTGKLTEEDEKTLAESVAQSKQIFIPTGNFESMSTDRIVPKDEAHNSSMPKTAISAAK
jgi:F-type H+/Na+-transporting ATPase subunit alpha